jgi:Pentapeptide repeats (8 copies)
MDEKQMLSALRRDVRAWNRLRETHPKLRPRLAGENFQSANLNDADLRGLHLGRANLHKAKLRRAKLSGAVLAEADLREADLEGAEMIQTVLQQADLRKANLTGVWMIEGNLVQTNLIGANLYGAKLQSCDLFQAQLDEADLREANLQESRLISASLRKANLTGASVFGIAAWNLDLEGAIQKDLVIPQELSTVVAQLPSVPVQPIILSTEQEWGMFEHFTRYQWVLPIVKYEDVEGIISNLTEQVIEPAEKRAREQLARRQ